MVDCIELCRVSIGSMRQHMSRQLNESEDNNCSSLRLGAQELGQGLRF